MAICDLVKKNVFWVENDSTAIAHLHIRMRDKKKLSVMAIRRLFIAAALDMAVALKKDVRSVIECRRTLARNNQLAPVFKWC